MIFRAVVVLTTLLYCVLGVTEPGHGQRYQNGGTSGDVDPATIKPEITVKHELKIDHVKNLVTVKDSNQWSSYMQNYAGKELFKRFESLPGVSNFQFIPGKQTINENYYDQAIIDSTRDSALVFTVDGASPYTLMFKAKEVLRRCKDSNYAGLQSDDLNEWSFTGFEISNQGRVGACRMESKVIVEGPIAIYGTLPGTNPIASRLLLLNQVKLEWAIKTDYTRKNTLIHSTFYVKGADFPKALSKVVGWSLGHNFVTETLLENPTHNALVHVGQILKSTNEKILRGE